MSLRMNFVRFKNYLCAIPDKGGLWRVPRHGGKHRTGCSRLPKVQSHTSLDAEGWLAHAPGLAKRHFDDRMGCSIAPASAESWNSRLQLRPRGLLSELLVVRGSPLKRSSPPKISLFEKWQRKKTTFPRKNAERNDEKSSSRKRLHTHTHTPSLHETERATLQMHKPDADVVFPTVDLRPDASRHVQVTTRSSLRELCGKTRRRCVWDNCVRGHSETTVDCACSKGTAVVWADGFLSCTAPARDLQWLNKRKKDDN